MTEMTVATRKGRILQALFAVLSDHPDGCKAKDAIAATRDRIVLTESEKGDFEQSGAEKFPPLVRFATIPTVKAGWMKKEDGVWTVTPSGLAALDVAESPEAFYKTAYKLYKSWESESTVEIDEDEESEAEVTSAVSLEDAEDSAREEVLEYLGKMPPFDFQRACAKLMQALGHKVQWVSPPGPDGGIDFVAYADGIGVTGRRIKGQAKRTQGKQSVDVVNAFMAKLAKSDDVGVFIALGGFTSPAELLAQSDERRLLLIDGPDFIRHWIENYSKLDEEARALLRLKPIWHLVRAEA